MRLRLMALAGLCALIATACGDSGESASTTTAAQVSGSSTTAAVGGTTKTVVTAPGIKNNKITVGGVNQESAFGGTADGAKARFNRFNSEGGIDGLTIDFLGSRDDGGDNDRNASLVKELVEKDGAYAIVPSTPTFMTPATGEYLKSKKIPYIGYGYAPVMCTNEYAFAFNGCTVPGIQTSTSTGSIAPLVKLTGKTSGVSIALAGRAESGGQLFTDLFASVAKHLNVNVVYAQANVPGGGTADMQPFADKIIAAKPDIVQLITDFPSALALKAKLVQNGYKGVLADNAAYVPGLLESSPASAAALEGTYVVTTYPTLLESSAYAKQMQKDLDSAGVTKIQSGTIIGYLQADLFVEMLKKASPDYSKLVQTMNAGVKITPADGGIPTEWPKFHTEGAACTSVVKVESKAYKLAAPYACYEAFK